MFGCAYQLPNHGECLKTGEIIELVMNGKMRLRWAMFLGLMMRKWVMMFGRRMWDIWGDFEGLNLWLF